MLVNATFIDAIRFNEDGLIPAIAQDYRTGVVLMVAWMNKEALQLTVTEQRAIYWSRSRQRLWRKGEQSGNVQLLKQIFLDCDADVLLLKVDQLGDIACHTGRRDCFYRELIDGEWQIIRDVIKNPDEIYNK